MQMVVLTWCESARDLGIVKQMLSQICLANRGSGQGTVVVLALVGCPSPPGGRQQQAAAELSAHAYANRPVTGLI